MRILLIFMLLIGFYAHGGTVGKDCLNNSFKSPECCSTTFGNFYFMETQEFWKDIPEYEGYYQASNLGKIKSFDRMVIHQKATNLRLQKGRILKGTSMGQGFLIVGLTKGSGAVNFLVHRLIAKTWIPNPENKPEVNHINAIRTDNSVANLEWATRIENVNHSVLLGLPSKGEKRYNAKTNEIEVLGILTKHKELKIGAYLLKKLYYPHLKLGTISSIVRRKTWKHVKLETNGS